MYDWTLAAIAALLLGFAALSGRLSKTPVTAAIFFVSLGYAVGGHGLGLIGEHPGESAIRGLAEATLTVVLFADASRIDARALRAEYLLPVRLLGIGLPLTIAAGGLIAALMFGGLSLPEALLVAVVLAPTDAALGQAVVTDPRLASRVRQGLNIESGLNDGICVPLLFILLAVAEADAGEKTHIGALRLVAEAIGYGILGGVVAGAIAALVLGRGRRAGFVDRLWVQVVPVAAAALAYGLAAPLGGSGFIAAFVAGLVFGVLRRGDGGDDIDLAEQVGDLLNGATFILFGAVLLGPTLDALTWRIAVYAVLSLTVIRMLPVAIALLGTHARAPTVGFLGWFGPRGLASIVFAILIVEDSKLPATMTILTITFATVALSVYAHGLSAQALTNRYADWYHGHPAHRRPAMESVPVPSQRWRRTPAARSST
jgi:NhaP-type Na+/H+ or K+/H+ antiporter